jgi:hypothetical protein
MLLVCNAVINRQAALRRARASHPTHLWRQQRCTMCTAVARLTRCPTDTYTGRLLPPAPHSAAPSTSPPAPSNGSHEQTSTVLAAVLLGAVKWLLLLRLLPFPSGVVLQVGSGSPPAATAAAAAPCAAASASAADVRACFWSSSRPSTCSRFLATPTARSARWLAGEGRERRAGQGREEQSAGSGF